MTDKANRCLTFLTANEGGWKPAEAGDPETYRGISRAAFPSWVGWKVVDDAKPLRRGQVILHLETPVLQFYEARFWDKFRLEERDEAMALVLLDYFAHSGAGPDRVSRLEDPDPFDVIRDRGHYMVDLACGFVEAPPERIAYWTQAFAGGWGKRLGENLEAVRKLGAEHRAKVQPQPVLAARGNEMDAEKLGGIVRAVVSAIGGYFVGTGRIDQETAVAVSGAAAVIAAAVWSVIAKRKAPTA